MTDSSSSLTHRRVLLEKEARATTNRLAVECQKAIRVIESHPHWRSSPELRHWWGALCQARTVLCQHPPSQPLSKADREIESVITELGSESGAPGGAAVTSAPLPVTITDEPSWRDLLGTQ